MGLNILIIGSGLSGLAAAAFLRKTHKITILEKSHLDFTKNDYGISIVSNAYHLLQKAGIEDQNLDMAVMTHLWVRDFENKEIQTRDFDTRKLFGAPSVLTRRSLLQRELYRLATSAELEGEPARIVENVKVEKVDVKSGVVQTSDGRAFTGELIIGADGINSVMRSAVMSENGQGSKDAAATKHDLLAYMAQIPISAVETHPDLEFLTNPSVAAGLVSWSTAKGRADKRRILAYHVNPREIQILGYASEEEFASKFDEQKTTIIKGVPASRAKAAFSEFAPSVMELFDHHNAAPGTVDVWRIRDVDPLEKWHQGRTLLIGDSAHAVTPHAGQGANLAFEDAEALGYVLRDANSAEDVQAAITEFLKIRKPRAQYIAQSSRHMGALLSPDEAKRLGEFDQVAFGKRTYGYAGAEAALKEFYAHTAA